MSFFDTAEKEGGKGSSWVSFANEEGITNGMGYTRAAMGFQVINNPCLYQGHRHLLGTSGHQHLAVKWSSTILPLYQFINYPLFIPGHQRFLVYTREKRAIHTSDRGVGSASSACILQRSDFWAACVCGAWASAIHAYGTILGSEFPPTIHSPGCPKWWGAVLHGVGQQLQVGQRLSPAVCQDERRAAASRLCLASDL